MTIPKKTRARRGKNEGSVYFRARDKRWCAEAWLGLKPDGTPHRKIVTSKISKTHVLGRLRELQVKYLGASAIAAPDRTLKLVAQEFLDKVKRTKRPSTHRFYRTSIDKHILPEVGHLLMSEVTPASVRLLLEKMERAETGARTMWQTHVTLSRLFAVAIDEGLPTTNPVKKVPRPKYESAEMKIWTVDQIRTFLDRAKGEPRFAAMVLGLVNGMRAGEIRGLRWTDVDFVRGTISIQRQHGQDGEGPTKTKSSRRNVPLMPIAAEALKAHRRAQEEQRARILAKRNIERTEHAYIFATSKSGAPVTTGNLHNEWKRAAELAELPDIRFHDLRHSCASLLLSLDVDVKTISELLGHKSVRITLDTYGHLVPSMRSNAVAKLQAALAPAPDAGQQVDSTPAGPSPSRRIPARAKLPTPHKRDTRRT